MNWQINLAQARQFIDSAGDNAMFFGPVTDDEIKKAEELLSLTLPLSFKEFLKKYGVGNYFDAEFYGLFHEAVPSDSAPCALWYTLDERKNADFPKDFVVIYSSGFGPLYCLSTSEILEGDCPVREWNYKPVVRDQNSLVSESYSGFLLDKLKERSL